MSSGLYDPPPLSTSSSYRDTRRLSSLSSHDRPFNPPPRRRSPSPGSSRRYSSYDRYTPTSPALYRDDYPNVYRPDPYYSRSPSPDRYPQTRVPEADPWERTSPWYPPSKGPLWQDRRPTSISPTSTIPRERVRRDTMLATRMFEPSEAWKQSNETRSQLQPPTPLRAPSLDRLPEPRIRDFRDASPDRSIRDDRSPIHIPGGDRYRPMQPYTARRPEYDSYRPQYDDRWGPPISPESANTFRRDPPARPAASRVRRISSPVSPRRSISPRPRHYSPPNHAARSYFPRAASQELINLPYDDQIYDTAPIPTQKKSADALAQEPPTRSPSRSSIASTHVSTRNASPLRVLPPPSDDVHTLTDEGDSSSILKGELPKGTTVDALPIDAHSTELPTMKKEVLESVIALSESGETQRLDSGHEAGAQEGAFTPDDSITSTPAAANQSPTSPPPRALPATGDRSSLPPVDHSQTMALPSGDASTAPGAPLPSDSVAVDVPVAESMTAVPVSTPIEVQTKDVAPPTAPKPPVVTIPSAEEIPPLSDAKSTSDALRIVVMTRLLCDRQTREERVNPVLAANLALSRPMGTLSVPDSEGLIREFYDGPGFQKLLQQHKAAQQSLAKWFQERQTAVFAKSQRLREEYILLHERWTAHCASLDEYAKAGTSESEVVQHSGRTTRRSTANLGDAVRSDLEMEQIIASLGNDEATDPNQLSARNLAVIPDMISVVNGQVDYVFDDTNHLVEDPLDYYKPHTGLHDWTEPEKQIFLDKFAAYPKQFGIISEFLPNKTSAQCVDYYYLHKKKIIDFRKVIMQLAPNKRRRRKTDKKKGNALLADIRQHDAEVNRDTAGSPTSQAAPASVRSTRAKRGLPSTEVKKPASRRHVVQLEGTSTATPTPEPEARPRRRRVANSGRITSVAQEDVEEDNTDAEGRTKRAKRPRKSKGIAAATNEAASADSKAQDTNEPASRRKAPVGAPHWSEEDRGLFLTLLSQHGDDFKRIAASMPNKTTIQVSNYYKSNLIDLDLERVASGAPKRSPTPEGHDWEAMSYTGTGLMSPVGASEPRREPTSQTSFAAFHHAQNQGTRYQSLWFTPPTPLHLYGKSNPISSSTSSQTVFPSIKQERPRFGPRSHNPFNIVRPLSLTRPTSESQGRVTEAHTPPVSSSTNQSSSQSYSSRHHDPHTFDDHRDQHAVPPIHLPEAPMLANRRPSTVPSINKGENPYPVLPNTTASTSSPLVR